MKIILTIISFLLMTTNVFAAYVEGTSHNDIVYLLSSSPNKIVRYDMSSEEWLADINLPITEIAGGIAVDDLGIYVNYDRIIYRYDLDGQNQTHVANTSTTILDLSTVGGFLVISQSGLITIIDQSTFSVTAANSSYTSTYLRKGLSSANGMMRVFGRSTGVSPSDIGYMEIDNSGAIVSSGDSPHHGSYPDASKTWVFPDETRVVDNAGIIYSAQSLSYLGSFAGSFDALTFVGDLPVLLRGGQLTAYSNTLLESGTYALGPTPIAGIFSTNSAVFVFAGNLSGYVVRKILLSDFSTVIPGEPINPSGLAYTPDAYVLDDDDNIIYLLSRLHASVFRWSIDNERYLESIPLLGVPEYMSVDTESNIIYLAYQSGKINKIDLNGQEVVERHFVSLPQSPRGLAQVGRFIFSTDASGAWNTHYTFNPEGILISAIDWNYYSREYIWNEANQKIYFFRDETSPNDLLWENINSTTGEIGTKQDSPYHDSTGIIRPIRVAPDGSVVVLGSGRIYDAISLFQINTLPNDILDAVWINGLLVTFEANSGLTNIQKWTSGYSPDGELSAPGEPLRIFSSNGKLLLIRSIAGIPTIDLLDLDNLPDDDGDGIYNFSDNCSNRSNPNQEDTDGDGVGDICDMCPLNADPCSFFNDSFSDSIYTDKWDVSSSGTVTIAEKKGTLNVVIDKPLEGCSYSDLTSKQTFNGVNLVVEVGVLLKGYGGMHLKLKKDDNNFVQFGIKEFGLDKNPDFIIGSSEAGAYTEQGLNVSSEYAVKKKYKLKTFSIVKTGDEYRAYLNGLDTGGMVINTMLGDVGLKVELLNGVCSTELKGVKNIFEYVFVTETIDGSIPADTLTLLTPNGGETIQIGSVYLVLWKGPAGAEYYSIDYSKDGGIKEWKMLDTGIEGKFYKWKLQKAKPYTTYKLRVNAHDSLGNIIDWDASDSNFTVQY